ncbi:hypothetical protein KP509_30G056300 [Ceratopteris richardii]|nr:hypothetical protein KP509_30G056300 [Ceratopteris richardii]
MATEPVVTCCGHLFCWPCLYQWLHLHSNQKECPVCKGFLSDELITPIYGRGASQDAEKNIGSTPARPHAHRVNGKRHWTETYFQERVERGHPAADAELQGDRNEGDISNAAELVLDRLRAAQRLREYINERFRIRVQQRLMGRRGPRAFRLHPLSNLGAHIQASSSSSVESSDQHNNEQDLTQVATSNPELADNTAAVGGSTDGVHDGPEDGQRTLEHVSTLPTHLGNLNGNGGVDAGSSIMEQNPLQETSPLYVSAEDSNSSGHGASTDLQVESLHLPQSSRHENVNASSSSCDSDPSSLRTRKRRRLN